MPRVHEIRFARSDLKNVGDRVTAARLDLGLSRRALAELAGVAARTLARIERGDQQPWPGTVRRLAVALQVTFETLAPEWADDEYNRPRSGATHLGVGFRYIRLARGMPLAKVAQIAGTSISTLSRFERGLHATRAARSPNAGQSGSAASPIMARAMADAFGFATAADLVQACTRFRENEHEAEHLHDIKLDSDGLPVS